MNCANHPTNLAIAYCRTCGKPLCATCKRDVMGVIYCEQCLAERLKDVHPNVPAQGFVPSTPIGSMAGPGPHPALAGILGAIPFGVGAVYNGQYTKALVHLGIFVALVWALSSDHLGGGLDTVLGIGLAFFIVYQIIDAVRSAHAIRMGQPAPDPFGFNRTFGTADAVPVAGTVDATSASNPLPPIAEVHSGRVPTAAVILIGLGVLFLLQTAVFPDFDVKHILPLFLIGLGIWLLVTRSGMLTHGYNPNTYYGRRVWSGPIWLITIGGLLLIQSFGGPGLHRTWPVFLLVVGLMKLMGSRDPQFPPPAPPPTAGFQPGPAPPPENQSAPNEVKNG